MKREHLFNRIFGTRIRFNSRDHCREGGEEMTAGGTDVEENSGTEFDRFEHPPGLHASLSGILPAHPETSKHHFHADTSELEAYEGSNCLEKCCKRRG